MTEKKFNSKSAETLAKWYLRFNGYFIVDNFIVHAGDDPGKISTSTITGKTTISNHTEVDLLAMRHKYSEEITGPLPIENDPRIINPAKPKLDFIIAEVKTGGENRPNSIWTQKKIDVVTYILRFAGFIETGEVLLKSANALLTDGVYNDPNGNYSVRLVVISQTQVNKNWSHLTNILLTDIIQWLVDVRGHCWVEKNIGTASVHLQWDELINRIFMIANDKGKEPDEQKELIAALLREEDAPKAEKKKKAVKSTL
jgi:hypothetical protein